MTNLQTDESIVTLTACKGDVTVVMDKVEYEEKISSMLSDNETYMLLDKDPGKKCEKQLKSILVTKKERWGEKLY